MHVRSPFVAAEQPGFAPQVGRLVVMLTYVRRTTLNAEQARWGAALELGARGQREIRRHDLEHYLALLDEVRTHTLRELARRDDRWLEEVTPLRGGRAANNHFRWFHVLEDEISHRGQMRWLRQRLPGG